MLSSILGFPGGSEGKESSCNAGHVGLILGRLPGERNGYPLQYSFPENPMNRGAWQAAVHGVSKSRTRLSDFHFTPASAGGFFTTEPPGSPRKLLLLQDERV